MNIKTMVKLYKELIVEKIQKSEKKVFWQICDKVTEIAKKDPEAEKLFKRMFRVAEEYVTLRKKWKDLSEAEVYRRNAERNELHDAFILSFYEMIEYIEIQTKERWEPKLCGNRRWMGDFAEYFVQQKEILEERVDILSALEWAQRHSNQVMYLLNASYDSQQAKNELINQYGFNAEQAQAICNQRMRAFLGAEKQRLADEIRDLQAGLSLFEQKVLKKTLETVTTSSQEDKFDNGEDKN